MRRCGRRWVDGAPFEFDDFADGQPDDGGFGDEDGEDCVEIVHLANVWVDEDCPHALAGFVCEVDR